MNNTSHKTIETNPMILFQIWLGEASKSEINDPEVMALATSTKNGKPAVRMMLLKQADENGFKFNTNRESHKGENLAENPHGAICFHWKTLRKQVRVEGVIKIVEDQETEKYFANRPYGRQIGAWASSQSRPMQSRDVLEEKIKEMQKQYPKGSTIPRPPYWTGYRLVPSSIEFWWDNPDRLHDRLLYTRKTNSQWDITRLYP